MEGEGGGGGAGGGGWGMQGVGAETVMWVMYDPMEQGAPFFIVIHRETH